jgi:hypothetical protein
MSPDYIREFLNAAQRAKLELQALVWAAENIGATQSLSEQSTFEFMRRYDHVFAVWFDPATCRLMAKKIKGPEDMTEGQSFNAIPVADVCAADHWRELFEGKAAPRLKPKPRVVTLNGETLN